MAEPTCVIHSFSYSSGISNETEEENPMYGLGESVSFGRFTTEPLSWEKWSAFSRNRYVDEAKSYSKPGSVAQKKAYFEAHFKRMAALKEAALLEQQANNNYNDVELLAQKSSLRPEAEANSQESVQINTDESSGLIADHNEPSFHSGENKSSIENIGEDQSPLVGPTRDRRDANKCSLSVDIDWGVAKVEKSSLQNLASNQEASATSTVIQKNPTLSSSIPLVESESSMTSSSSPVRSVVHQPVIHPGKENVATPTGKKSWIDESDKKRTPLRMSINREFNRLISPVIKKIGSSSKASSKDSSTPHKTPAKASVDGLTNPPLETPHSRRRRVRALFDSSASGGKVIGPRWQFLSAERSKSSAASRNKTSPPAISSFCLRSRDRALKRKENLEEKSNAKTAEKGQGQSKSKGKATDINKLHPSFCFGARPSSESFREKERPKRSPLDHKVETSDQQLTEKGKSTLQNSTGSLLPPRRLSLKKVQQKKAPPHSSTSS